MKVSRRGLIGGGTAVAGVAAGFAVGDVYAGHGSDDAAPATTTYPFRGAHQAGIVTPAQDRLHLAAFDITTRLAGAAGRAAEGLDRGGGADDPRPPRRRGRADRGAPLVPPDDTGEAIGLSPGG